MCTVTLCSLPVCADEGSDAPASGIISSDSSSGTTSGGGSDTGGTGTGSDTGNTGDTGGDSGTGTGGDTGTGTSEDGGTGTNGDTSGTGTGGDSGTGTGGDSGTGTSEDDGTGTSGDTSGTGTNEDGGTGTSGDTSGTGTGGDSGTGTGEDGTDGTGSSVLMATMTPVTMSSSSDGDPDTPGGSDGSDSSETRTLAVVTVSMGPGSTPLNEGGGTGYTFDGTYAGGGSIEITQAGTYYLTNTLTAKVGASFAIKISAPNVVLDGQDPGGVQHSITGSGSADGITTDQSGVTIRNFMKISGFSNGIYSTGSSTTITGNKVTGNTNGIISYGASSTISGNTITGNTNGIAIGVGSTTITDNTITGNTNGIAIGGGSSTVTGNTITGNTLGIVNTGGSSTITGNTVTGGVFGLYLTSATGSIYNNYFASTINVGGSASGITWTRPGGPTRGTNVMGGPTIAGNYWSNPTGTGWSDTQPANSYGYSTIPYEVTAGVYDTAPLVPWNGINPYPSPPSPASGRGPGTPSQPNPTTPSDPPGIVIAAVTIPSDASPGAATTLTIGLENEGSLPLPSSASYVFVPANEAAQAVGEFTATASEGEFNDVTLPFTVPAEPGVYTYEFQPYRVETNPDTGEEVRVPAGALVSFTVTVGEDGSVWVVSLTDVTQVFFGT